MNVKQLYEILGKYIDVGAGEWVVVAHKRYQFKTRKDYRWWLKLKSPLRLDPGFDVGEVMFAAASNFWSDNYGTRYAVLCPAFFIKDENKAMYYLPSEDFVKAKAEEWNQYPLGKPLELAAKRSKGSKKGSKKSAKTTNKSKKK